MRGGTECVVSPLVKIIDSGKPPATESVLQAAELRLGLRLPQEYREFLKLHNGGEPEPSCFGFTQDEKTLTAWIHSFRWLGDPEVEFDLTRPDESVLWLAHKYRPYLPEACIPIAGGPNLELVVSAQGKRKGEVWIRNWDAFLSSDPDDALYFVAASFNQFLSMLSGSEGK